jgi:hypothetical protein
MNIMLLHAQELRFQHPVTMIEINVEAMLSNEFRCMLEMMKSQN